MPSALKATLLRSATLLLYTPAREHFGIVPLEAMRAHLPVLAADSGGPVETVVEGETGWLRSPLDVPAWTAVVRTALAMKPAERGRMGQAGAQRVRSVFGREHMAERLESSVDEVVAMRAGRPWFSTLLDVLSLVVFFGVGLVAATVYSKAKKAKA